MWKEERCEKGEEEHSERNEGEGSSNRAAGWLRPALTIPSFCLSPQSASGHFLCSTPTCGTNCHGATQYHVCTVTLGLKTFLYSMGALNL